MKKALSLLFLAIIARWAAAQEIVYENHDGNLYGSIVIPYESLIFPKDSELTKYAINLQMKGSQGKWINVIQNMKLDIPRRQWLENTAIPVDFTLKLEPGKYQMNLKLRNKQAGIKKQFTRELIMDRNDTEIGLSWVRARKDNVEFIPSVLSSEDNFYDNVEYRQQFSLEVDSLRILAGDQRLVMKKPSSPLTLDISPYLSAWKNGRMLFSFFEANIQYNTEPFLYTPWFSYSIRYSLEDQMAQIRYIASQNEWQVLSKLPPSKYMEAMNGFWANHDPSPGTIRNETRESFSQRVLEADERYTSHKKLQGWKSDQGRIFIKYGEPDDVSSEVFPLGRYPNIIWSYYKENKQFIFADTKGFGQYSLRNKQDEY